MMRPSLGYFFLKSQYKRQFEKYLRESFIFFHQSRTRTGFKTDTYEAAVWLADAFYPSIVFSLADSAI